MGSRVGEALPLPSHSVEVRSVSSGGNKIRSADNINPTHSKDPTAPVSEEEHVHGRLTRSSEQKSRQTQAVGSRRRTSRHFTSNRRVRSRKTSQRPRKNRGESRSAVQRQVDVFGNSHPGVSSDDVECFNCGRQVAAGRFAPHLHKCMGKGRQASRQASKAWMGMIPGPIKGKMTGIKDQPVSWNRSLRNGGTAQEGPSRIFPEEHVSLTTPFMETCTENKGSFQMLPSQMKTAGNVVFEQLNVPEASTWDPASRLSGTSIPDRVAVGESAAKIRVQNVPNSVVDPFTARNSKVGERILDSAWNPPSNSRSGLGERGVVTGLKGSVILGMRSIGDAQCSSRGLNSKSLAQNQSLKRIPTSNDVVLATSPTSSEETSTTTAETCQETLSPCSTQDEHGAEGEMELMPIKKHGSHLVDMAHDSCYCPPLQLQAQKGYGTGTLAPCEPTSLRRVKLKH